jgi:hypothetical protein
MPTTSKIKSPAKPHSLKKLVQKMKADAEYHKFIRSHIRNARKGDKKARATLKRHFKPTKKEVEDNGLDASALHMNDCTNPTTLNLVENQIS